MRAIIGLDAAWTANEPTGVSLVEEDGATWRTVAVAPSYASFVELGQGVPVDWGCPKFPGSWPSIPEILEAARKLTTAKISVVAVDMPIATVPFDSRRAADSAISREFGGRGCAAHSPNAKRPGELGANLMAQLEVEGFPLATTAYERSRSIACAVEVYPHPALLALLARDYRVPYKVSKSGRYWKRTSVPVRIANLLAEFEAIRDALQADLGDLPLHLPRATEVSTLSELKRYEDSLDSVVCAWVGLRFLQDRALPYGDSTSAVWVPDAAAV